MNLYPARFDKFSPGGSLDTGGNGSTHFGVKFSYKMRGGGKQHKRGGAICGCDLEFWYAGKTYRRVGVICMQSTVESHTNTASPFAYVLVTKKTPIFCNRGPQFFT